MRSAAAELAHRLARNAEAACRHYLPSGRREGRYWLVGDVADSPGRSLFVRLSGADHGKGAAGKWSDAATGEHGDLLDLIAASRRCTSLRETLAEARTFLSLPQPEPGDLTLRDPAPRGSPEAARRLWAIAKPIRGTLAEAYLHDRGLADVANYGSLRFHPRCWYRPNQDDAPGTREAWPALVAATRDHAGTLTGIQRTWLDPAGSGKAPIATPRRAMGDLLGNGVWFGRPDAVMIAGEGIETILSLRQILPTMPMVAALSANHLAALALFAGLRRLYLARDDDQAGHAAVATLRSRAHAIGIEAPTIVAVLGDFNDDLRQLGRDALAEGVRGQLAPEDTARFLCVKGRDPG
ncbi:toprim domain-containing protein [Sphingomonas donggukensis]|uniref:Toprim domain-containing protein n=1 Tax=Sphingomonas donggukensis TaxID=2949093 RepID=A0ABY4TWK9_9SPHN|nr:toprim domain-containing protein [Sphingomonas donggukensis]URW75897.1 toprim domain-containing protein [Sphingomonas donggukensis]